MTKTNAKRGMVQIKTGYGKDSVDYDFLYRAGYMENESMHDVIAGIRSESKRTNDRIDSLQLENRTLYTENASLKNQITEIKKQIDDIKNKYHEALKGVLKR